AHEVVNLLFVVSEGLLGEAPGGQVSVAAVSRGLGVGKDHAHVFAHQIIPVLDTLGVILAYQESGSGVEGRSVVGQQLLPVFGHQTGIGQDLYVGDLVVGDHIGTQSLQDGSGLGRRAAVGLLDVDRLTLLRLPVANEFRVQCSEQLPRDIVGGVEQLAVFSQSGSADGDAQSSGKQRPAKGGKAHVGISMRSLNESLALCVVIL